MIKIALLGYGKMGKEIECIVKKNSKFCIEKIIKCDQDLKNFLSRIDSEHFSNKCIVIDFTHADSCQERLSTLLKLGYKIVSGTTGWNVDSIKEQFSENLFPQNAALLHSPNFSIGVNIFWSIIEYASRILSKYEEYKVKGHEIHHAQKKDAPSGTAIYTENIIKQYMNIKPFSYERIDDHHGIHSIEFHSENDSIEIKHNAKSREMFAKGALDTAQWIQNKNGFFTMENYLSHTIRNI